MSMAGDSLNKAQAQAVAMGKGPALVVAGAGTGKTRVIVERVSRLLAEGVAPKLILALTFTEKAAAEMLDRVTSLTGSYQLDLPIMTFNAYGESLLRRYAADIGLSRSFTLMGDSAQVVFLRERIDELALDYFAPVSRPDGLLGDIADYFSVLKQNVITPEQYLEFTAKMPASDAAEKLHKAKHQELAQAYQTYIRLCREADTIDYDDQIYLLIELFRQRPNIQAEVQAAYDYVMVDEFQDTNTMQSVLVDMIVGKQQNLFVVGDDDQSIYGWRGATLANILDFKVRYPKAQDVTLIQNYRSSQAILDSAHKLILNNNPDRLEERLGIDKRLVTDKNGEPPQVYRFKTLDDELQWIAEDIKQRLAEGAEPSSIAVLARRNTTVQLLHSYLDFEQVEHVVAGQRYELYQEPVVRAILGVIKAVVDPGDSLSLYHTLSGPLFDLSPSELSTMAGEARRHHQPLVEYLQSREDVAADIQAALAMIHNWREKMGSLTVGQLAFEIIETSGYKDRLYAQASDDSLSAMAINRLSELFKTMKQFEQVALQPSAVQYVEALPALQAAGDSNEDDTLDLSGQVVNVLTIHKSKGLEWPIVYIADCTEGSFPLREMSRGISLPEGLLVKTEEAADSHLAEERRLMYVAMTRAKDELILTHAERHSSASVRKPSRFLAEAFESDNGTDHAGGTSSRATLGRFAPVVAPEVPIPSRLLRGEAVNLTVSQATKYLDCPLDFYYCYVLNVPQEANPNTLYGSLMHSLIETMNRSLMAGKLVDFEVLEQELAQRWPKGGYLSSGHRDRAEKQAKTTLKQLYQRISKEQRVPVAVEEAFSITLPDSKLTISGRFDAILPHGNSVEIVDYKTSTSVDSPAKAKQRATASQQLTLYALAWQQLHDELPAQVTLDFVDTALQGSVKKTQRGIDGMKARLQQAADGIRAHAFEPGKEHLFCIHPPLS